MRDLILDQDDLPGWDGSTLEGLRVVAGIDISFFKDSHVKAVAALALLKFPSLEVRLACLCEEVCVCVCVCVCACVCVCVCAGVWPVT